MTLDLAKYAIVVDVWEGSAPIDEDIFKANGVEAMFIRMNPTWGGLEYDSNFLTEWAECSKMRRAAYVVVSPLNVGHTFTSEEYVDWIMAKKPLDCQIIALDVEIDTARLYNRPDITPLYYGKFVAGIFAGLHAKGVKCIQYSGAWFYGKVSPWVKPDYVDQWWARYMGSMYPAVSKDAQGNNIYPVSTWPDIKARIAQLNWTPLSTGYTEDMTGRVVIWQISSVFVLPGCPRNQPVDINIMLRTDFERIFGGSIVPPVVVVPPVLTDAEKLTMLWDAHPELHP